MEPEKEERNILQKSNSCDMLLDTAPKGVLHCKCEDLPVNKTKSPVRGLLFALIFLQIFE